MPLLRLCALACACLALISCRDPDPVSYAAVLQDPVLARMAAQTDPLGATGGGYYDLAGLPVQFAFSSVQSPQGKAAGQFHIYADEGDGLTVDVAGEVICMTEDAVNHRAWIGALVTRNSSTDPAFQTEIHEVGDDVWFRVVDYGEGSSTIPDRTSFTGFKGAAGIQTSPEYCAARIWPDGDARTWPVTAGTISVRP